mgnify:FL=1
MNEDFHVEKDWTTRAGLRAVVIYKDSMGFRCGYVGVPKEHPLHGKSYEDVYYNDFYVHGVITYSGCEQYPVEHNGLWCFGYDCAHLGDATAFAGYSGEVLRSLEYCVDQCESLADQLVSRVKRSESVTTWQPIQTAPKDGQFLLMCNKDFDMRIAHWNGFGWDDGDFYNNIKDLTHWMPLPPPPENPT